MEESELSIDEEEIKQYLEGKQKLRNIVLPQDSNDLDRGSNSSNEKIGQKNLAEKEKVLARALYIQERDRKILAGDKIAASEFMAEQTELRNRIEEKRYQSRLEYDLARNEERLNKKLSKITQEDRDSEKKDIEKIERKRDKEVANLQDWFNSSDEEWEEYSHDNHTAEESLARVLITRTDYGYCCGLHRYKNGACSAFEINTIESHFRTHEPEIHKQAIIETINEKYNKLIQERRDKTLEDKEVVFKRELRDIDSIKTRPDGDAGLIGYSGKKITKGDKARIRREEEALNEENRRIYRGLYS